jgi:hypothetical protein
MKSRLEQKIDSEAQWTADPDMRYTGCPSGRMAQVSSPTQGALGKMHWWLHREYLRMDTGVYATSDVTTSINTSFGIQYALHISKEDKEMVAYTPSYEAGCADKQIKTTIGKFLRKHFFLLTDAHIQMLESDHRAEINAVYKVATTSADIRQVYTTMDGDSGCMRKDPHAYGIENDVHPSEAYEAPGMGVAYTERDGVIKSRAVIWVNPIDAKDKRFVRLYGDPVLKKLLTRDGFVQSSLVGAKLKKIPYVGRGNDPRGYLSPYLDGPGGAQSDPNCWVAIEGDYLVVINANQASKFNSMSQDGEKYAAQSKSYENARVLLEPMPNMEYVSEKSGKTYSMMTSIKVLYCEEAGVYKLAASSELSEEYFIRNAMEQEGKMITVRALSSVPMFFHYPDSRRYIDTPECRRILGYEALSPKYYPAGDLWCHGNTVKDAAGESHFIKQGDLMDVLDVNGTRSLTHTDEFAAMRKLGYVRCSPIVEGREAIIHKNSLDLGRSVGGTVFSKALTDRFQELFTGEWVRTNESSRKNVFGVVFRVPKDQAHRRPTAAMLAYAFEKSSYTNTIRDLTAGIVGANSGALKAVNTVVEATIVQAIYRGAGEEVFVVTASALNSAAIGSLYRSSAPYADVMRGLAAIKQLPSQEESPDRQCIEHYSDYLAMCDVVTTAFAELQATLKVMITQTEAEEAGQRRLVDDALDAELDNLSA